MSLPGLSTEDAAQAARLLGSADREAGDPFQYAVVRLLVLLVWAVTRRDP